MGSLDKWAAEGEVEDGDDLDLGAGFTLGLTAGLIAANSGPCDREGCPRAEE